MFQIAIPSYNRSEILKTQSLAFLKKTTFPLSNLTVFVANKEQEAIYLTALSGEDIRVVVAEIGIRAVRNFITNYYEQDAKVLSMDDDIQGLWKLTGDTYALIPPEQFVSVVEGMFEDLKTHNRNMFGIYPTKCKMFQKQSEEVSTNLKFLIGHFFGVINKKVFTDIDYKEDYQRSIEYSLKDGGVLRYNRICAFTRFGLAGGVNKSAKERHDTYEKEITFLLNKYPHIINRNKRREAEILLTTSPKKFLKQRQEYQHLNAQTSPSV